MGSKESRSADSCRRRSTVEKPSTIFPTVSPRTPLNRPRLCSPLASVYASASIPTGCLLYVGGWSKHSRYHPHSPYDEHQPRDSAQPVARRSHLFEQDEPRDGGDPQQVHHPRDKQQGHERPTATRAVSAVLEPHQQSAPPS